MAFTPDDPAELEAAQLAAYSTRFQGRDVHPESFLGKLARAEAQGLWSFQKKLQRVDLDVVPSSQTSYARLADFATVLGLSDGQGGYGALKAVAATGLQGTASGTPGAVVWSGVGAAPELVAPDGSTLFVVAAAASLDGSGVATLSVNASTPGTAGNLLPPASLTFVSPPAGVSATVPLTAGASNGADQEAHEALLARILARLRNPPKGGTQADWNTWAGAAAVSSVARVYGFAKRNGTGTVDEVVAYAPDASGFGTSRQVSAGDLALVLAYVDGQRPVAVDGRRILTLHMPAARALSIRTRVVAYPAGAFDWSSGTLGLTVFAYSSGTGAGGADQLTLSADAPADLQAAIAAGTKPRLQVVSTAAGVAPAPVQVRATAYAQVAGPMARLDLETPLPTGFLGTGSAPPNVGDAVYSGGPAATLVARDQLAYVNGLGPSRSSGYADPDDAWDDLLATEQLARVALDAVDASGDQMARNVVKVGGVPQVTIAVGAGAPSTSDFQPADDGVNPPEAARASHVVVTD